jgi:hypothetical protein
MGFLIYVDASGDPGKYSGKNTRYYVLAGISIPLDARLKLENEVDIILKNFFPEGLPKEIIARDIVNRKGYFSKLSKEEGEHLILELLNILIKYGIFLIAIVINKEKYWEKYFGVNQDDVKKWSMNCLIDRIDRTLERKESVGLIIYDYEGKKDKLYRELIEKLRKEGSIIWPSFSKRKISRIIDTIMFTPSNTTYGLQLADLTAYIIRDKYERQRLPPEIYNTLEKLFDKNPATD